jgi:hypothetical protein
MMIQDFVRWIQEHISENIPNQKHYINMDHILNDCVFIIACMIGR